MGTENDDIDIDAQIAAHNAAVDGADDPDNAAPGEDGGAADEPAAEDKTDAKAAEDKADGSGTADEPAKTEETSDDAAIATVDEPEAALEFKFTPELSFEEFDTVKSQVFEQYDEVPDEIVQMIDYLETKAKASPAELEGYSGDRVAKTMKAFDQLYDTAVESVAGRAAVVPNAKPVVEFIRDDYEREYSAIAAEILMSDSLNPHYKGASVFQEVLQEIFRISHAQFMQVYNFLVHQTPLPKPSTVTMPAGIDESLKDAYFDLSERRRFDIESLANEIAQIERDMPTLDAYYKGEAETKLAGLRDDLSDEVDTLKKLQTSFDNARAAAEAMARQNERDTEKFNDEVKLEYYTESFELSEKFAKIMAAEFTFLDPSMRLATARATIARLVNAMSFLFDDEFNYVADDTAAVYQAQLKDEGINFDFNEGSKLLYGLLLATRHLKVLKQTGHSKAAIERAEDAKKKVLKDIKAAQHELLGQITAKYVTSAGTQLKSDVAKAGQKKQFARKVAAAGGGGVVGRDTPKRVEQDRLALNARIDAELEESGGYDDILFDRGGK